MNKLAMRTNDDIMEFPKASEDVKAVAPKMEKVMIPFWENDVKENEEVWKQGGAERVVKTLRH